MLRLPEECVMPGATAHVYRSYPDDRFLYVIVTDNVGAMTPVFAPTMSARDVRNLSLNVFKKWSMWVSDSALQRQFGEHFASLLSYNWTYHTATAKGFRSLSDALEWAQALALSEGPATAS